MSEHVVPHEIPFRTLRTSPALVPGLLVVGVVLAGLGSWLGAAFGAERMWGALLFNWLYWSSLAIGMVIFAVALHLTVADWAWSVRRFSMAGAAFLPLSYLILLVLLLFGSGHIFHEWLEASGDPIIEAKHGYLNLPFLLVRQLGGVAVLFALAGWFVHLALRPDLHGVGDAGRQAWYRRFGLMREWRGAATEAERSQHLMNRLGPILALVFVFVWGATAIDLAMSLHPHFFSTMFPVAFFVAAFHGGIAMTALAMTLLRSRLGLEKFIVPRQYHDLGKLLFGFTVFWMYVNWGQYVVIWYGQLPIEQEWFAERFAPPYALATQAAVLMIFVIPFLALLPKPPKRVPAVLAFFAGMILLGNWLERFLLVAPSLYPHGEGLPLGLPEIGVGIGFGCLFAASYLWFMRTFPALPSPASLAANPPATITVRAPAAPAQPA